MGCATSKKDEEDDVILLCKERKRLLKMAVERRSELADAQCKYNNSLYAVAAAIRLFVSRYSSPCSPFLITFPSTTTTTTSETNKTFISKPMFLQQRPSELTHKTIPCLFESSKLDGQNEENPEEKEEEVDEQEEESDKNKDEESESQEILVCDHFYGEMASPMPLPQGEFQWDFFSPFDGVVRTEEVVSGFGQNSDEDLRAVRAKEGIPDLEEDGEKVTTSVGNPVDVSMSNGIVCKGRDGNVSQGENECLRVIDTPSDGRELLEALKDVVDLFIRAYDSGLDVSRMLETNMVQVQSALEGIQENSNKLIRSITRSRSTSPTLSWSSSCKTLLTSSSKSSSTWTEFKSDMFDDYGGMESGSHSLTLGRLYAWEKKLYQEMKSAVETRKIYEQKCLQLRNQEAKGDSLGHCDKTAAEVKCVYIRTLVSIRRAESISERVQKLRDQELQPQLIELLHGLMRNWKIMQEMHETQNRIMYEVKSFNCPAYGKFSNDSHQLATLQLDAELQNWHTCFATYVSSQKAYVEALNGWLSKFVTPEAELYSNGGPLLSTCRINAPPLLVMCHDWLVCLNKLPDSDVTYAMKSFRKDVRALLVKQAEEQEQKRKVDGLAKELDRKDMAFQRAERIVLDSKLSEQEAEMHVRSRIEYLMEKKEQLDMFRKRTDMEKVKHQTNMHETQQIAVNGFQTGFSSVFESLAEFLQAAVKMYVELVTFCENSVADEDGSNTSFEGDESKELEKVLRKHNYSK